MTAKVFIDGEVGTTGLQIRARLESRADIELLSLSEDRRKDVTARAEMLNAADVSILCLPDDAAKEAVSLIENPNARVIDASTAYRVADEWDYGFAEYDASQTAKIAASKRVSNPGCYAVASISMLNPLMSNGILAADTPVTINAISGYTGGGKGLIASFEDPDNADYTEAPFFVYGLNLAHKHVPEITKHGGLKHKPIFVPSVGRFAQGMIVQIPLQLWALPGAPKPQDVHAALADHYAGRKFVEVTPVQSGAGSLRVQPEELNNTNMLRLHVFANEADGQALVMAQLDNLGKGASGSCVQNLNIMLGVDEGEGLL